MNRNLLCLSFFSIFWTFPSLFSLSLKFDEQNMANIILYSSVSQLVSASGISFFHFFSSYFVFQKNRLLLQRNYLRYRHWGTRILANLLSRSSLSFYAAIAATCKTYMLQRLFPCWGCMHQWLEGECFLFCEWEVFHRNNNFVTLLTTLAYDLLRTSYIRVFFAHVFEKQVQLRYERILFTYLLRG